MYLVSHALQAVSRKQTLEIISMFLTILSMVLVAIPACPLITCKSATSSDPISAVRITEGRNMSIDSISLKGLLARFVARNLANYPAYPMLDLFEILKAGLISDFANVHPWEIIVQLLS